jgi:hypothetical protein
MNRAHRRFKIIAVILAVLLILGALVIAVDRMYQERLEPIRSPNARRTLVFENERILTVRVIGDDGVLEARINTHASRVMRWRLKWDGNDRIVLKSADIGDRSWIFVSSGGWVEEPGSELRRE